MKLGIVVDGPFDEWFVTEMARRYGAKEHFIPVELDLALDGLYRLELDENYGEQAPYERVFRLLNKRIDALLVFTTRQDGGVGYAAIRKARQYSMPVEVITENGSEASAAHLELGREQAAGEVGGAQRGSDRGSAAGTSTAFGRVLSSQEKKENHSQPGGI